MAEPTAPESQTPEPLGAEPPLATPPVARWRSAWWLLFALFGLVIAGQLYAYFEPGDPDADASVPAVGSQVRLAYMQERLARQVETPERAIEARNEVLRAAYDDVKPHEGEELAAARWGVILATELGGKPAADALARLARSDVPEDKALRQIYTADRLTPEAAAAASADLPAGFQGDLARIRAQELAGDEAARERIMAEQGFGSMILMVGFLVVAVGLGVLLLIVFGVLLLSRQIRPVGYPRPALRPIDADRLAGRMALYMILFLFVPTVVAALLSPVLDGQVLTVAAYSVFIVALFASFSLPIHGVRDRIRSLIGETRNGFRLCLIGVGGFLMNLPIAFSMAVLFHFLLSGLPEPSHPVTTEIAEASGWLPIVCLFIVAAVFAPLIEELTFRGLLFPALGRYIGVVGAVLLSAFMFAAIHPQGPVLWGALAAVGATAAVITYYTGSLIPAIVMHAVHNATILMLARTVIG